MARYLVVDDSRTVRMSIVDALKRATETEIEVVEAETRKGAVDAFRDGDFHLVFLDLNLPDGKGTRALEEMLELRPGTRVIIVTALPDTSEEVIEALSLGAFSYIRKPVRVDGIRTVLDSVDAEEGRRARIR